MRDATPAAAIAAHVVLGVALGGWLVDDGGIALSFARNLAEGHGFVPWIGGPSVEGFSDPAWIALLAIAHHLGAPLPIAAKVLGLAGGAVAIGSALSLARRLGATGGERAVLGAFLGLSGPLALWSVSGLEGGLYAGAVTAGAALPHPLAAALALGIATASRPEGLAVVMGLWLTRRAVHHRLTPLEVLVPLATAGLLLAWRWTAFGTLVPNTALAKLGGAFTPRTLQGAASTALALLWLGGWVGPGAVLAPRRPRALLWPVAIGLLVHTVTGGDWMRYGRLLVHVVPLGAVATIPWLVRAAAPRRRLLVTALIAGQIAVAADVLRRPPLPMALVAEWGALARSIGPAACREPRLRLAGPDVGGLLWTLPSAEVLDLARLVEPPPHRPWPREIAARRPQLVLTHGVWVPRTGLSPEVMSGLGYRPLCVRRGTPGPAERAHPTTVWLRGDCTGPVPPADLARLQTWCARPR